MNNLTMGLAALVPREGSVLTRVNVSGDALGASFEATVGQVADIRAAFVADVGAGVDDYSDAFGAFSDTYSNLTVDGYPCVPCGEAARLVRAADANMTARTADTRIFPFLPSQSPRATKRKNQPTSVFLNGASPKT